VWGRIIRRVVVIFGAVLWVISCWTWVIASALCGCLWWPQIRQIGRQVIVLFVILFSLSVWIIVTEEDDDHEPD
jgi:hypothetical protein